MSLTTKSVFALLLAGSLSACGGGGGDLPKPIVIDGEVVFDGNLERTTVEGVTVECNNYDCTLIQNGVTIDGRLRQSGDTLIATFDFNGTTIHVATDGYTYEYNLGEFDGNLDGVVATIAPSSQDVYNLGYLVSIEGGYTHYESTQAAAVVSTHHTGYDGSGQTVVVLDGYSNGVTHGYEVSGIVNEIAPGAEIVRYDIATPQGSPNTYKAFNYIANNVEEGDIVNLSIAGYGSSAISIQHDIDIFERLGVENALFVVAAGNDGREGQHCQAIVNCNRVALTLNGVGTTIVVGALNREGTGLESYSTQAGILKDSYISAPVYDAKDGQAGTSYAAPVVSGTAALIMDKYNTDASATRDIIFDTADDLGAVGVDTVYGHGRLNIGRALSPVGQIL